MTNTMGLGKFLLLFIITEIEFTNSIDMTKEKGAYGDAVVTAACKKLLDSCIFPNDYGFMRRVAWVESKFGRDLVRLSNNFKVQGGIWQVDPDYIENVQQRFKEAGVKTAIRNKIINQFGVDLLALNRDKGDLEVPINNLLVARAGLYLVSESIPMGVDEQAIYWKKYYNKNGAGTTEKFSADVAQIPGACQSAGSDLLFILDSSGSITESVFVTTVIPFVKTVVSNLTVGYQNFKIAVDDFSSLVSSVIKFNSYTTKAQLLQQIQKIPYKGHGTDMSDALLHAATYSFSAAQGARSINKGYARLAVLITDGLPSSKSKTYQAADRLKTFGINLVTVGVGNGIDIKLLTTIASNPKCTNVYSLSSYNELAADFPAELKLMSCQSVATAPVNTTVISNTLAQNQTLFVEFKANLTTGITFKVTMSEGKSTIYFSRHNTNPSSVEYDFKITGSLDSTGQIYISPKQLRGDTAEMIEFARSLSDQVGNDTDVVPVFAAIVGEAANNNFTLSFDEGNTVSSGNQLHLHFVFFVLVPIFLMKDFWNIM